MIKPLLILIALGLVPTAGAAGSPPKAISAAPRAAHFGRVTPRNLVSLKYELSGLMQDEDIRLQLQPSGVFNLIESATFPPRPPARIIPHRKTGRLSAAQLARMFELINAADFSSLKSQYLNSRAIDPPVITIMLTLHEQPARKKEFAVLLRGAPGPSRLRRLHDYLWEVIEGAQRGKPRAGSPPAKP